ncbi:protein arginine N-methyltransferase 5 [Sporothrix brasiliensis 5110]|uniref:Protein arginine N-methyltransferase n=1 Tax=Sporothrix brasiliensis 5110 TaxID=1398154 RepID=A0A0C2FDM6_9PEZI|nr:protein arginine N-methyltransferase 5 [Sporothrix brasiliensis 5110]KIH89218.1 protein arginine N-methyltransferase 5 [Sporothrix brasiliensis 5110]
MSRQSSHSGYESYQASRPSFYVGQHDSRRIEGLTDNQYRRLLDYGFSFATAPITTKHFRDRVIALQKSYLANVAARDLTADERANPSLPGPTIPTLTDEDTTLFPGPNITSIVAYCSPWIDLYSAHPLVANLSRQALNLEVSYASFCGVRSIVIPGPRADADPKRVAQYGRAIKEALRLAAQIGIVIHLPMYREPGLEETGDSLSGPDAYPAGSEEIDIYSAWDTWHSIRTMCDYEPRLFVAVRVPKRLPEIELQTRWFAEPLHFLTFSASIFQQNRAGFPSLSRNHQSLVNKYMRLKNAPWILLADSGPSEEELTGGDLSLPSSPSPSGSSGADFPSLADAHNSTAHQNDRKRKSIQNAQLSYIKHLEREQEPYSATETSTLANFQDWLQSPLQPLADNLESATYEVFEGDPVKYDQYEKAIAAAMVDWKTLNRPSSAIPRPGAAAVAHGTPTIPELVVAVAGAGRGPLVTRVIRASKATGVPIQLWALEKNQNAYVYLLRMNKQVWGGKVHLIKTDMREWAGPVAEGHEANNTLTKVDILVTELLGSFGDNELSPECLDGIQRHIARPHGISIPQSYTAHLSPISYPKVYAELSGRSPSNENAFETPYVVHLFAIDLVSQKVPGRPRFQQAWEFVHPVRLPFVEDWTAKHGHRKVQTGGGGAMNLATGLNEHNMRHCHLTFVCRPRGVIHGLAGYFESVLYQPAPTANGSTPEPIEISTRPDQIDHKSKDMISWFPIFFPLKDSEIEVSMWRQTDDTRVWYEWLVEVFVWAGPSSRVKVAASELHSSRNVACLM